MRFPKNITKDHLIKAIEEIDKNGIPLNGDSDYYDVLYNSNYYPPKLIVSIANLFANGKQLDRNSFDGGINTPCFNLLKSNGFEIVFKEEGTYNSDEEIANYLQKFEDQNVLNFFLSTLERILENTGIEEKDKRIAFTFRKNVKQISINLGRKLVFGLYRSNKRNYFCIYFAENDVSWAKEIPGFFKEEIFETKPPARLLYFESNDYLFNNELLVEKIRTGINELLPHVGSAGQPEKHNHLVYRLAVNGKYRAEFFRNYFQAEGIQRQVMVYEVKSGIDSQNNSAILRNKELNFFYWNDSTFRNLKIDDYVFVVNLTTREVLFTKLDKTSIKISTNSNGNTSFTDENITYTVSGEYEQFIRLKILMCFNPESQWKWKSLGQPQNTYLAGPHINLKLAENRLTNISQLKELSTDSEYQKLLDYCSKNFTGGVSDEKIKKSSDNSLISAFNAATKSQNLYFPSYLAKRYVASLVTKPFVIFTGLSGSGKTKLAQTFAKWMCQSEDQYKIIPVGADWTNREPLLGYPNSLDPKNYVLPDNGALALVIEAAENANGKELKDCDPYFLILDEMNLSHVERYFADFLSAMESKEEIMLYSGEKRTASNGLAIPDKIKLPPNLFIVGTVNIDETTYMFSPKVLDRANTIEFRLDEEDISSFFTTQIVYDPEPIEGQGSHYAHELMQLAAKGFNENSNNAKSLLAFFGELQKLGAEFGYRTASEMIRLMHQLESLGMDPAQKESALDVAVMQKMLPKLHGSRSKLTKILPILASFCLKENNTEKAKQLLESYKNDRLINKEQNKEVVLPLSFIKIARMYTNALESGFANYAEG